MNKKSTEKARAFRTSAAGYDAAGHMDPNRASHLLALGRNTRHDEPVGAFFEAAADDLAEELAEAAVSSMTTGEDELRSAFEAEVEEDHGGPFVVTSGNIEFAGGTDESNIEEATREPFPTT